MSLPAPLAGLGHYQQFICWKLTNDDPPRKIPISPYDGRAVDAHDTRHWVTYDQAAGRCQQLGLTGVAFVFAKSDPFWFLDIDKCLQPDGTWSQLAQTLCQMFAGAAVEVSQSGRGLHLFGRGEAPPHSCKNTALGLEFYTEARFVALTGINAVGDCNTDHGAALPHLVAQYFPYGGVITDVGDENWQDMPAPEYNGPYDDTELVGLMLNARQSVASVLRGNATANDLWFANAEVLAMSYPPIKNTRWDESSADMALAQHLAFWTGRNTERMRRLMWQSGLRREKWEKHRKYLWMTISNACANTRDIFIAKRIVEPSAPAPSQSLEHLREEITREVTPVEMILPVGEIIAGEQWMPITNQLEYFKGCAYVSDEHQILVPSGKFLDQGQFRVTYGGYNFSTDGTNTKTTKNAWEAFTESQGARFPKVDTTCFRPELPPLVILKEESQTLINTYVHIQTAMRQGDPTPFVNHIRNLLPEPMDQQILLAYMAACVQYPGAKLQWCPVLQGMEGNGKTVLIEVMTHAIGYRYTHLPNAQDLGDNGSKFNAWILRKMFVGIEEITVAERHDILEALKPLVTNRRIEIQGKGSNQVTGDNRANFMMCCNKKNAIPASVDKRRYAIFFTAQQKLSDLSAYGMSPRYFRELYDWLRNCHGHAIVNHFLRTYPIPQELNPAYELQRAPATSSTGEALVLGAGRIEQEVNEAIAEGKRGFADGWISSNALDQLLKDIGGTRAMSPRARIEMLADMGYHPHPALPDGRVTSPIPGENGRPRLFIKYGTPGFECKTPHVAVEMYMVAQKMLTGAGLPTMRGQ